MKRKMTTQHSKDGRMRKRNMQMEKKKKAVEQPVN
jgi:hypothetical protein